MKRFVLLLITIIVVNVSYASFPVEKSYSQQSVIVLPLSEQFTDDYLDPEPDGFCNNFANISFYFGVFWFFVGMIGAQLRYLSSEKILGEILMIFASIYSVLSFMSGILGLFTGEKRWQSLFGILLSVPGLILTWLLIKYGFDFYE